VLRQPELVSASVVEEALCCESSGPVGGVSKPPQRRYERNHPPVEPVETTAAGQGGQTCSCNIAALCRRHHRLKTHAGWRYRVFEPGSYLWTSPHGYTHVRDDSGTRDVSPNARRRPAEP
jgi:hypothetical protein